MRESETKEEKFRRRHKGSWGDSMGVGEGKGDSKQERRRQREKGDGNK